MIKNYLANVNDRNVKKVYVYSDYALECIVKLKEAEPIERFNVRNRKSVMRL